MTVQEYRKMTKGQLAGRKVRTNVTLKSRAMEVPAGTVLTVVGKSNGCLPGAGNTGTEYRRSQCRR